MRNRVESSAASGLTYRLFWKTVPATVLGLQVLSLGMLSGTARAQEHSLRPQALAQIGALLSEKSSRTPEQRKIDSRLLFEIRTRRGEILPGVVPPRRGELAADSRGRVEIDLGARVSEELLAAIVDLGGVVVSSHPRIGAVRVRLRLETMEELAARPEVRFLRPADRMITRVVTEGDVAHGADVARAMFDVDGTGVMACAMSDSVDALADLQTSGELPPDVTVLPGQSGNPGSSEGTALLEILHDLAPGASLGFATGAGGQAQMAQNILDLAAAGCDVIADDVFYFAEAAFQDGVIAQAVDQVAAAGVLYFSSAGNSGNLNDGTSGVWEGDFSPTALPAPLAGAGVAAHDFGGGNANTVTEDPLNDAPFFTLQWADPLGAAANDYDLFLLDAALANVLDFSTNTQDGTQDPFEAIDSVGADDSGNRLVVVQFAGAGRFLHLNTHRGRLAFATDGQITGHAAAESAFAVAAVNVATAGGGRFTGGAANPVEPFSSDGPRRIFFDANGSPVSLSGLTVSRDGELRGIPPSVVRQKPDLAAADGVMTTTPGFDPFFGTSASVPHAAGIAALLRELAPGLTTPQARNIFKSAALDIEAPGFDRDSGVGILDAELAMQPIFTDGFESGDTSAWSSSVP